MKSYFKTVVLVTMFSSIFWACKTENEKITDNLTDEQKAWLDKYKLTAKIPSEFIGTWKLSSTQYPGLDGSLLKVISQGDSVIAQEVYADGEKVFSPGNPCDCHNLYRWYYNQDSSFLYTPRLYINRVGVVNEFGQTDRNMFVKVKQSGDTLQYGTFTFLKQK